MKFSINQSELQNALSVVLKGIATRSTLPILSGIYLDAHDDTLTLQATDLELSIQYSVSALIEETGKAVVPGKLFSDIVKNLPDAAVHVEAEDDSAVITCDTASFSIKTLDAEDFPGFPHVDVQQEIIHMIPSTKEVLDQVIPNYITGNIYGCLVESYASENNARMTAMQSSTDNAKEMLRDLSIQYNRARQAAITQEITEVIAGAKAQKRK